MAPEPPAGQVPLRTIALEWIRIGATGFGGPATQISMLRHLAVTQRKWLEDREFEDAIAACNLLPGPASTQLAIFCARRLGGVRGAVVGGLGFIVPAVVVILALSVLFLAHSPPAWIRGAGAGAGAAVAAVAVHTALGLLWPRWKRTVSGGEQRGLFAPRIRWVLYALAGAAAAAVIGPYLVLVLLGCGLVELAIRTRAESGLNAHAGVIVATLTATAAGAGGIASLAWVAFKVGALSYGGGFVIVPLIQSDAVHTYHWMTSTQFLNAVALGQVTPGPVVATVAAVGYAAHGLAGGLLAALVSFAPSFVFVLVGGGHFSRLRGSARAQAFLAGAGPAAIGAILGAAIPLAAALSETWQFAVLAGAAVALLFLRRGIVTTLAAAGLIGALVGLAGGPLPR